MANDNNRNCNTNSELATDFLSLTAVNKSQSVYTNEAKSNTKTTIKSVTNTTNVTLNTYFFYTLTPPHKKKNHPRVRGDLQVRKLSPNDLKPVRLCCTSE